MKKGQDRQFLIQNNSFTLLKANKQKFSCQIERNIGPRVEKNWIIFTFQKSGYDALYVDFICFFHSKFG